MAQGGRGVVVPGCSLCKVRLQTVSQYSDHLCERVQAAVDRQFALDDSATQNRFPMALHKIPLVCVPC